jgi:hypothetical protein
VIGSIFNGIFDIHVKTEASIDDGVVYFMAAVNLRHSPSFAGGKLASISVEAGRKK